jgi:hypothetical protein
LANPEVAFSAEDQRTTFKLLTGRPPFPWLLQREILGLLLASRIAKEISGEAIMVLGSVELMQYGKMTNLGVLDGSIELNAGLC